MLGTDQGGRPDFYIGPDNYAFNSVGSGSSGRWSFYTAAGKDEILAPDRRHELTAIAACEAAQRAQARRKPAQLGDRESHSF
jgi:hypothetical protein